MERHKLWNDRAEKLMRKTFESWSKDKKKKVREDFDEHEKDDDWWEKQTIQHQKDWEERIRKSAIEMGLDPDEISGPDFPSNMPDGSWREHPDDEVDDSVEIFGADSVFNLDDEDEEVTEQDFGDQGQLGRDMEKATSTSDKRSDTVAGKTSNAMKLQDVLVTQVKKIMASATKVGEEELTLVLRKMLKNVGKLMPQQGGEEVQEMTGEEEYEDPEVQKAAEKARTAKIDSVKAQLKALQKQG